MHPNEIYQLHSVSDRLKSLRNNILSPPFRLDTQILRSCNLYEGIGG
jgi:hypothetical protein